MTHYSRSWECYECGEWQESIDYPKVALCDICKQEEEKHNAGVHVRDRRSTVLAGDHSRTTRGIFESQVKKMVKKPFQCADGHWWIYRRDALYRPPLGPFFDHDFAQEAEAIAFERQAPKPAALSHAMPRTPYRIPTHVWR